MGDFMIYINKNILEKELYCDGTVVLKYHIEYPCIYGDIANASTFNDYNKCLALNIQNNAETELYNDAVNTYIYNKKNGYPTMVYEVYTNFEITYNKLDILSLYIDEYTFTGGAHGSTIRSSQTWNLSYGKTLELASFFPCNPYFMIDILNQINAQIAKEPDIYFDNTCQLVLEAFNPRSFYITPNAIVIYFQQYDIAPYSSGIREFFII